MAGRPKHYEEEKLIEKATQVFWSKGYKSSSAKDLMEAMEVGQGSFYLSFKGGKKELYKKSLLRFSKTNSEKFSQKLSQAENPIEVIRFFFRLLLSTTDQQKRNGCYLGNAIVEMTNLDEETKKISEQLLCNLEENFEKALTKAQEAGYLSPDKSPRLIAKHLITFWNGINVTLRTDTNRKDIEEIINMNLELLK